MNNTAADLYELHWNNHAKILKGTFDIFRNDNELVDVTLSCEGKTLKAHKIVLSACSDYFLDLFRDNPCHHPIIIMTDINYDALVNILNFMYMGEINIVVEQLNTFLKTAERLRVKGLAVEISQGTNISESDNSYDKYIETGKLKRNITENDCQDLMYQKVPKVTKFSKNITNFTNNSNKNCGNTNNDSSESFKDYDRVQTDDQIEIIGNESSAKPVQCPSMVNREDCDQTVAMDEMKTEIIDLDILADDSIEYSAFEANSQQEYKDYSSLALKCKDTECAGVKTYPCPQCDKVFNHYISLKLHLPRHSGDTSCALCHAVLGRRYDLKVHMRRKHNMHDT